MRRAMFTYFQVDVFTLEIEAEADEPVESARCDDDEDLVWLWWQGQERRDRCSRRQVTRADTHADEAKRET